MTMTRRTLVWMVGLLTAAPLSAQVGPQGSSVVEVGLALRQLDGVKRVLMIGAHPDDEDSSLLAALARGMGVETAYLSLTRGDGGQNIIGPELGEGLGIIRTGELEAARVLDGEPVRPGPRPTEPSRVIALAHPPGFCGESW